MTTAEKDRIVASLNITPEFDVDTEPTHLVSRPFVFGSCGVLSRCTVCKPKRSEGYRPSSRATCGLIVQQTTANPSHTNSPSAKTSSNNEAFQHGLAPLRDSRCCWDPAPATLNFRYRLRRMLQEKPHYVSATTEECKAQQTNQMISLDMPSGPTTPLSVTESKPSAVITNARSAARYLDICAGRSALLSVAASKAGLAVLVPLDADSLLGGETHDLADPNVADYVLQLTWSGSIGFAAEAPMQESTMSTSWRRRSLICSQQDPDIGFFDTAEDIQFRSSGWNSLDKTC